MIIGARGPKTNSCCSHVEILISRVISEGFRCMVRVSNYAISSSSQT